MVDYKIDKAEALEAIRKGADGMTVKLTILTPALKGEALAEWLEQLSQTITVFAGTEVIRASAEIHQVRMDVSEEARKAEAEAAITKATALAGQSPEKLVAGILAAARDARQSVYKGAKQAKEKKVKDLIAEAMAASA